MRIAIDARLNAYRRGGIPQYTRQLLTALAEVTPDEQFVSLQHREMVRPLVVAPNVARRTVLTPPHHRFEHWTLPLEVLLARPDVLHCPDFIAPLRRPCPAVVTIHDLAFLHYPQILDAAASAYYSQVRTNTERADGIIAVSEATRQDIAQFLDIPEERIAVIYEAAAPMFRRLDLRPGEARVLNGAPLAAGTFMLFVSTLEPRKNLPTLLQALRICLDRHPACRYRLVIVGGRGWNDEPIFAAIRDLRLADHVLLAGSVGQYDLRWLYNACQFYINPSLYEGFGLPLLEAMACGAACAAAATSSMPEIGGEAAIYVPPLEPDQWADLIIELWDNEDRQEELGRMGLARAARFSWLRAARETLKVYRQASERHERGVSAPLRPATFAAKPEPSSSSAEAGFNFSAFGEPRRCLRCGSSLVPGELQYGLSFGVPDSDGTSPLIPHAWACPRCGYAELVLERPLTWPVEKHAPLAAPLDQNEAALATSLSEFPLESIPTPATDSLPEYVAPAEQASEPELSIEPASEATAELAPAPPQAPIATAWAIPLVDLTLDPEDEAAPEAGPITPDEAAPEAGPITPDEAAPEAGPSILDKEASKVASSGSETTRSEIDAPALTGNAVLPPYSAAVEQPPEARTARARNGTGRHETPNHAISNQGKRRQERSRKKRV